jgi:hypothetical protein
MLHVDATFSQQPVFAFADYIAATALASQRSGRPMKITGTSWAATSNAMALTRLFRKHTVPGTPIK